MTTQTFAYPSFGSELRSTTLAIASTVAESLSWLSPRKAREELLSLADARAKTDPAFAARVRKAARANWFGEA